jgi:hypothetical protein
VAPGGLCRRGQISVEAHAQASVNGVTVGRSAARASRSAPHFNLTASRAYESVVGRLIVEESLAEISGQLIFGNTN